MLIYIFPCIYNRLLVDLNIDVIDLKGIQIEKRQVNKQM